ncbi:type IV secretory system conjugative DNA transfer family protein [Streptomyces sp. NPDC056231]|uniref:type IV secretory system conjugative DNA transfer family protein n=1 Tax=Streptomyces sp. NPDC056231 TaxID=3345755 RepID=UPI003AAA7B6D
MGNSRTGKPQPWDWMRSEFPEAAARLDGLWARGELTDVDVARILTVAQHASSGIDISAALASHGAAAVPHSSEQRDLPARLSAHNLLYGQVRLGRIIPDSRSDLILHGDFGVDLDVLRTSMLVIGPPGSGKTRGIALPIVEHLSLEALAGKASVVAIDPKGDDFARAGWFDVTIDPLNPTHGFSLYGGATEADMAADRLASALLPSKVTDDKAYFMDASKNALYACLAPFRAAHERWPTIRELLNLMRCDQAEHDRVRSRLAGPHAKDLKRLLQTRAAQANVRVDPAASLLERLTLLDRPALIRLFDHPEPFEMREINKPVRVRVVLPEAEFPDASSILARLVVSQFVQVTSSATTNRRIFKALVMDEAGRFVDDYIARGIQRVRSNNAGMILLSQTLGDFPQEILPVIFGSTGCKAVFSGIYPQDAKQFSDWFGDHYVRQVTVTRGTNQAEHFNERGESSGGNRGESASTSIRHIERARWSVSDIITDIPYGACLATLTRSNGKRVGPLVVDLRT